MTTFIFTNAEIEASNLCHAAGITASSTDKTGDVKAGAAYVLALAERIKSERANITMQLAAN